MSSKPNLLIVADNAVVRHWIKKHLEDQFFTVESSDESHALDCAGLIPLDFIILDSGLETCDPLVLCRKLRQINLIVPILLITGRLKKAYRDEATAAGVTDFLSSQFDPEELARCIATGLRAAEVRKKTEGLSSSLKAPPSLPTKTKPKKWSVNFKPKKKEKDQS